MPEKMKVLFRHPHTGDEVEVEVDPYDASGTAQTPWMVKGYVQVPNTAPAAAAELPKES